VGLSPPDPPLTDGVVVLRPFDKRDLSAIDEALRDADVEQWFGKSTFSAREFLENKQRRWSDGTSAAFAVCDAGDDAVCRGQVFIEPGEEGRAEVGYWVLAASRGRGRASRAVVLASLWAFAELRIGRLQLWAEPENVASQRVAERAGYQTEGVLRSYIERGGARRDVILYSLLPSDPAVSHFANPS
jgi:RimJ/RimL family protein N-acetyltransferase